MYFAYNTRAVGGGNDNTSIVREIAQVEAWKWVNLLGYETWADYVLEENMAKSRTAALTFLNELMDKSLPFGRRDVEAVRTYALANGFVGDELHGVGFQFLG